MIIDTDVIVWYFRKSEKARRKINSIIDRTMSAVSYMELLQGIRNKEELKKLKEFVIDKEFTVIPLSDKITNRAIYFMKTYTLTKSLRMADALIAATAIEYSKPLLMGNVKHFKFIRELKLKHFRQRWKNKIGRLSKYKFSWFSQFALLSSDIYRIQFLIGFCKLFKVHISY